MKSQYKAGDFTLSEQEVKIIIHSTNSFRDRTILKALYYAGLRREEVTDLNVKDIDLEHRRINVTGKFGKSRIVPFFDFEFMGDIKHLLGNKTEGKVFCKTDGSKLTPRMINKIVMKAGGRANLKHPNPNMKHINPHLFRHSIARHLKSKGLQIEAIQNFLGHASFKTTMDTYGKMGVDEMQLHFNKKFNLIEDKSEKSIS